MYSYQKMKDNKLRQTSSIEINQKKKSTPSSCRSAAAACKLHVFTESTAALHYVTPNAHTLGHTCVRGARRQHI